MTDLRAQVVEEMAQAEYQVDVLSFFEMDPTWEQADEEVREGYRVTARAALDAALTRLKAENLWLRGVSLGRFLDEVLGDSGKETPDG